MEEGVKQSNNFTKKFKSSVEAFIFYSYLCTNYNA